MTVTALLHGHDRCSYRSWGLYKEVDGVVGPVEVHPTPAWLCVSWPV